MEKQMLTILFHMTVKPEREAECAKVINEATSSTRAEDEGCITYTFYRQSDEPRHLVLFEQWRDADALSAHIARLQRVFGPPDEQEPYPATHHRSRLPKAFLALFEKTEAARYEPII
jgi:quinol monooxygenase YgiN